MTFWLHAAGFVALASSLVLVLARWLAFEPLLKAASRLVSPDGIVTAAGRDRLSTFLLGASVCAAAASALLAALANRHCRSTLDAIIRWDPLKVRGLTPPDAYAVMLSSAGLGLLAVAVWTFRGRLGTAAELILAKEGPLEHVTFLLQLVAACLCAAAARRWRKAVDSHALVIPMLYALCGLGLFLIAMEEINWGQTLLGFETPPAWAAINHQQETSIHNLLDRDALTSSAKAIAVVFGAGVLISISWGALAPRSVMAAIAPHVSLAPLALMIASGSVYLHPEIIELLLAVFFVSYSARIYMALSRSATGGFLARPAVRGIVAAALIAALLTRADWTQISRVVVHISAPALAGIFGLMALGLVVSAWKWSLSLRLHDLHYSFAHLLRVLAAGFFFNNFLPTAIGGDAYRIYMTLPRENYRSRAISAVAVERAMGFVALLTLGGFGALTLVDRFDAARVYCVALLTAAAVGITGFAAIEHGWFRRAAERWRANRLFDAICHNLTLLHERGGKWSGLAAASIVFQAISIAVIYLLFDLIDAGATMAQCALIAAVVGVSAALPISLNGLGVMEGTFVAMAVLLGIDYEAAVVVALMRRALALVLGAVGGLLYAVDVRHREARTLRASLREMLRSLRETGSLSECEAARSAVPDESGSPPGKRSRPGWNTELLEYTHDAIIIWEMNGTGILYWNKAAEQLYGYAREEAHGRVTHDLLKTRLAGGVENLEMMVARYGIWIGELQHTTREGRTVQVEARLALMSQHNGRWLVLEVNRDISDRKAAEINRAATERQLAEVRALRYG